MLDIVVKTIGHRRANCAYQLSIEYAMPSCKKKSPKKESLKFISFVLGVCVKNWNSGTVLSHVKRLR